MSRPMLIGVHETRPPAEVFADYPGARATRPFIANRARADRTLDPAVHQLVDEVDRKCRPTWDAGGTPVVSLKLRPSEVLTGTWDRQLTALGVHLTRRPDTILLPWHEPENDHTTPAQARAFVRSFNHTRTVVKAANPDVEVAFGPMTYQWRPGSATTADPAIWRAIEADLYLLSVYSGKSFPDDAILPEHAGFIRCKAELIDAVPGRRWGIAERGILAAKDRAATWRRELDWLTGPGTDCQVYMIWNSTGTEQEARWVAHGTAAGGDGGDRAVIREVVATLALPIGYHRLSPTGITDVLVHEGTGILVHRTLAGRFAAFLRAAGTGS